MSVYGILDEITASARYLAEQDDIGALKVLARQAERLAMGRRQYGKLDPIGDRRVWLHELRDELTDALTYIECEEIRFEERPGACIAVVVSPPGARVKETVYVRSGHGQGSAEVTGRLVDDALADH